MRIITILFTLGLLGIAGCDGGGGGGDGEDVVPADAGSDGRAPLIDVPRIDVPGDDTVPTDVPELDAPEDLLADSPEPPVDLLEDTGDDVLTDSLADLSADLPIEDIVAELPWDGGWSDVPWETWDGGGWDGGGWDGWSDVSWETTDGWSDAAEVWFDAQDSWTDAQEVWFDAADVCTPDCVGKACGDDGCGGTCGFCSAPHTACQGDGSCGCAELACGDLCCAAGKVCTEGVCHDPGPVPEVFIYFENVSAAGMEIWMINSVPVSSWSFQFSGGNMTAAYGGTTEEAGLDFSMGANGTALMGVSLGQDAIPAGEGLLVNVDFDLVPGAYNFCVSGWTVASPGLGAVYTETWTQCHLVFP